MPLRLKLWGVRGSLPAPSSPEVVTQKIRQNILDFAGENNSKDLSLFLDRRTVAQVGGYGGHTSCAELRSDENQVIFDGGSGIRVLGQQMMAGPAGKGQAEIHIVFTHFHWDHLIGLPFFTPLFVPGNKIHLYAIQPQLEEVIRTIFRKPFFPVPFEQLQADIEFHIMPARQPVKFGDLSLTGFLLDHPDPCYGFRIEKAGQKALSYCVDTEGTRVSRKEMDIDLPLYQGIELLVFDAQYTLAETTERINWGHSAATIGLDIAVREKIRRVIFVHHDPAASDEKIAEAELQTRDYYQTLQRQALNLKEEFFAVDWCFATEGMELVV